MDLARKENDMEVKDLMLGDWIEDGYKKAQVTSITCDGIVETTSAISNIEVIEPIPLTEEILMKNGFVYLEADETCATNAYHHWQLDGEYLALDDFQYWRKEKKDDLPRFRIAGIDINYVHQLQHLLRLCGIEKELTI